MTCALALARRWVQDYFNRHDAAAARDFCAPGYTLRIGDATLAGRDEAWLPAVDKQMRDYPGLTMTVHQTLTGEGWAALWFSEHGQRGESAAVWSGVAIYDESGGRLTGCIAQEDYFTRRRQLKIGRADPVDPPAVAPWDQEAAPANPAAEAAVIDWAGRGWPRPEAAIDDEHITGEALAFEVERSETLAIRSAGDHVAVALRQQGAYRAGLPDASAGADFIDVNALVRVAEGRVVSGRVIRDRMGLWSRRRAVA